MTVSAAGGRPARGAGPGAAVLSTPLAVVTPRRRQGLRRRRLLIVVLAGSWIPRSRMRTGPWSRRCRAPRSRRSPLAPPAGALPTARLCSSPCGGRRSSGASTVASPAILASVAYTSPASSSPSEILAARARTLGSSVSAEGLICASPSACPASAPQGTSTAHRPISRSPRARSASPVTPAGLPAGVASTRVLVAIRMGSPWTDPSETARSMVVALAVISTSASAPAASWATSVELPAITEVTLSRPSNTISITSVSDDAAMTTTSPSRFSASRPPAPAQPATRIDTAASAVAHRAARPRRGSLLTRPAAIGDRIYPGLIRHVCCV